MDDIRYEVADDGVATLTFCRPEVMNAVRRQTTTEILAALDDVRRNDAVRCLVLTGEGRGFCAGDDFQAIFLADDRGERKHSSQINRIKRGETSLDEIFGLQKPTIAAVNGPAVGYGMDISLYCDIRIAAESAKFGWFFTRRAVMGTIGGTFVLRQLVGLSKAVPDDQLMDAATTMARKIAAGPPLAQQMIKRAVHKSFEMPWTVLGEYQQAMGDVLWQTDDHMEGVHSFTERREPRFTGH